ncbi:prenyltransferase/squalene oxidase repeat-containing protein [Streptomyces sp. NPDC047928]|uniref:prenyltransferase/squalene oxidase repeat-containing protein n=1 Tax=unclassified Streptomyces TaxID=2593676 RepID=UPI0037195052
MPLTALRFLRTRMLDRREGGVHGWTVPSGRVRISPDKDLDAQAAAVLVLAEHGSTEDLTVAMDGLRQLIDRHGQPGFTERADRFWRARPTGRVRTPLHQLDAGAALLAGAHRLDCDATRSQAVDVLNRCLHTAVEGRFPTLLSEDWRPVRGGDAGAPLATAAAVRALDVAARTGEDGVDASSMKVLADRLSELVEGVSVWPRASALPALCGPSARVAHALARAGTLLAEEQYLKSARTLLARVVARCHDPGGGGFWDRAAIDGRPRVDWTFAVAEGGSPFPVKTAEDAALVALAARALEAGGFGAADTLRWAGRAVTDLADHRHGGVFRAIGHLWATEDEPAVLTFQQLGAGPTPPSAPAGTAPPPPAPQAKSARTQALVALAFGPASPRFDHDAATGPSGGATDPAVGRTAAVAGGTASVAGGTGPVAGGTDPAAGRTAVVAGVIDPAAGGFGGARGEAARARGEARRARGLWVVGGARGGGLGTPVPRVDGDVPLPLDHDRLLRVVPAGRSVPGGRRTDLAYLDVPAAYRVMAMLRLLGDQWSSPAELLALFKEAQNPDGGFGVRPGQLSDAATTATAVLALHLAGRRPARPGAAAGYLLSCRRTRGGFGGVPGAVPDVWHTGLALAALRVLRAPSLTVARPTGGGPDPAAAPAQAFDGVAAARCAAFVAACRTADGGYANRPGLPPTAHATRQAVAALLHLGLPVAGERRTVQWLRGLQTAAGGFGHAPGRRAGSAATHHALAALTLLGARPAGPERCERWLVAQRQPAFGLPEPQGAPPVWDDDGFHPLQSLSLLRGAPNRDWTALVT